LRAVPAMPNPLKSGSAGASKLRPSGMVEAVSAATATPENFGVLEGPGIRTLCRGFRRNTKKPPARPRQRLNPSTGRSQPMPSGSATVTG
jgi:hypothetical protein